MTSYNSPSRISVWTIWITASLFYAYQYIIRVMPNIMLTDIMNHFDIDAATFGQFSGFYYIGYSLMHLPIGILLDRFGPKKIMAISIFFTAIGLLPLVITHHWIYPIIGRMFIGMGSSAAILGVFKIIHISFPRKRFSRMLSLSVTIGLVGAIYGGYPVSYLCESLGYQTVIKIFISSGILLSTIAYLIIPPMKSSSKNKVLFDIKEVISNKKVLWCCFSAGLMVGPLEGFADVWGITFLEKVYVFPSSLASSLSSMIFIGMCFGAPLLSLLAEKVKNESIAIIGAGIFMILCFFFLLVAHLSFMLIGFGFILVGVCCSYQVLAIYKASTYVRKEITGLTTAITNMIIMIFGYGFHVAIGNVIHLMGGTNIPTALTCGISIIPIALCIGTGGFFFLARKENTKKRIPISNVKNLQA